MNCLNETEVQMVVDAEAGASLTAHVAECARCRARVDARARDMASIARAMDLSTDRPVDPAMEDRLRRAIADGARPRGATTLRAAPGRAWTSRRWTWAAAAAAAALAVFLVAPRFGSPTTLSASEILGRSLKTMTSTTGVETLEYEFYVPTEMKGPHRIEQLIDHDRPGRYRFANYAPDGSLESAVSQDPANRRRSHLFRVDGRNYIVVLTAEKQLPVSLPEMGQALIETAITMMQATADQNLSIVDGPAGRKYVVEMPAVTPASNAAVLDLYRARAVVDGTDFRIEEFEASGALLRQPYSVSFRLINRSSRPSAGVAAEEFALTAGPGDVVLSGATEVDPVSDVVTTLVRELARAKAR
jgi:hypothetical protein